MSLATFVSDRPTRQRSLSAFLQRPRVTGRDLPIGFDSLPVTSEQLG